MNLPSFKIGLRYGGWRLTLSLGGLLGWYCGARSIFSLLFLVLTTGTVMLGLLALKLLLLLFARRLRVGSFLLRVLAAAFLALLVGGKRLSHEAGQRRQRAETTVQALQAYRQRHGIYPADLQYLPATGPGAEELHYYPDALGQQFRLSVLVDDWHFYAYDSQTRRWSSGD